jgi:hypothetical protein
MIGENWNNVKKMFSKRLVKIDIMKNLWKTVTQIFYIVAYNEI